MPSFSLPAFRRAILPALFLFGVIWQPVAAQLLASSLGNHEVFRHDEATGARLGTGAWIPAASGGLSQPHGILDRSSGVLVASFGDHTVKRYDRVTGAFLGNFVPNTAGMAAPTYLALGPADGLLYVSSQANDRMLRFNAATGAAADATPFISGGQLDGPSGFGWSPDGTILYVSGRYSANLLAYQAATGAPLASGHVVASGLSPGSTFGLCVEPAGGDIFIATGGTVRRYTAAGQLAATIPLAGAIGLEVAPDGQAILVAANHNVVRVQLSNHAVSGPLLSGATYNILNFFHVSRLTRHRLGALTALRTETAPGQTHGAARFSFSKYATEITATLQFSEDLAQWTDGATYTPDEISAVRDASAATVQEGLQVEGERVTVTERRAEALSSAPLYFRVAIRPR